MTALDCLPRGEFDDPFHSKRVYAKGRLIGVGGSDLLSVGRSVIEEFDDPDLELLVGRFASESAAKNVAGSPVTSSRIAELDDWSAVHRAWAAASEKLVSDPEGAITASRTMLESVCSTYVMKEAPAMNPGGT